MKSVKKTNAPTTSVASDIFKSYDIRGTVPNQLNPDVARLIGRAFVAEVKGEAFAVGRDMRGRCGEQMESKGSEWQSIWTTTILAGGTELVLLPISFPNSSSTCCRSLT